MLGLNEMVLNGHLSRLEMIIHDNWHIYRNVSQKMIFKCLSMISFAYVLSHLVSAL